MRITRHLIFLSPWSFFLLGVSFLMLAGLGIIANAQGIAGRISSPTLTADDYPQFIHSETNAAARLKALKNFVASHPDVAEPWLIKQLAAMPTNASSYHVLELMGAPTYNFTTKQVQPVKEQTVMEIELIREAGRLLSRRVIMELFKIARNSSMPFEARAQAVLQLEIYGKAANGKGHNDYHRIVRRDIEVATTARPGVVPRNTANPKDWPELLTAIKQGLNEPGIVTSKTPNFAGLATIPFLRPTLEPMEKFDIAAHVQSAIREIEEFERTFQSQAK
jgi:hypothetical protein